MLKKDEKLYPEINEDEFIQQLAGGFSLREPEDIIPRPNSFMPIYNETLEMVTSLCDARGFDMHDIWKRVVNVIQSRDMEISGGDLDEDLEVVSFCPKLRRELLIHANDLKVPIEDLLYSGVLELCELLHLVDKKEFEACQQIETVLQDLEMNLESISEMLTQDWYHFSFGIDNDIMTAGDHLCDAKKKISHYLHNHASPPKASEEILDGTLTNNTLGVIHEQ